MRTLVFASIALAFSFAVAARAEDAPEPQAIITQQLDAFVRDDAAAAYAFAAPEIRAKFADPGAFMAMVKRAYPPVYRHRSVQFGEQVRSGDEVRQRVTIVDGENEVWGGMYTLDKQPDGLWRITSCLLVKSEETSL